MEGKINMAIDNELSESELVRVFDIKDTIITCLQYDKQNKMLLAGSNVGQIAFFESDTGKLYGISNDFSVSEEISSINLIEGFPFLIYTTTFGKINIIACPPLQNKF